MKNEMIAGLLFSAIAAGGFASEGDGIFGFNVGQFEVYMLVDAERDGSTSIIPGADEALIKRCIPASGFKHSTNVFLIKAPGRNILVDTGFGSTIFAKMEKLGVKPDQVDTILITHLHGDHFGGLQKDGKALFPKAKIYLDTKELDFNTKIQVNQGAVDALNAYGSNVVSFDALPLGPVSKEIIPGISAVASYGHTPGHTAFLVESGSEKFLIAGDFLHIALVQFPRPDISATYDSDQKAAADSRRQIMDYAAKNKIPVGGMHVVYPAVGYIEADGAGYRFLPSR